MADKRIGTAKCGFCLTDNHEGCVIETSPFFGRTWRCSCGCEKGTKKARPARKDKDVVYTKVASTKASDKVATVAQRELDKVLASDEVRKVVEGAL